MRSKRHFGSVAMIICLGSLLVFTFGFMPSVLATPPENREIETITVESIPQEEIFEQTGDAAQGEPDGYAEQPPYLGESDDLAVNMPSDSDVIEPYPFVGDWDDISWESSNINAISKEQAIEIANTVIAPDDIEATVYGDAIGGDAIGGAVQTVQTDFRDARYVDSADPIGTPSWFVVYSELTGIVRYVQIPDNTTPEEFLAANSDYDFYYSEEYYRTSWIGTHEEVGAQVEEDDEPIFIMATALVRFIVVEINALTGEFIERGVLDWTGYDLAFDAFYGDIRENLLPWLIE